MPIDFHLKIISVFFSQATYHDVLSSVDGGDSVLSAEAVDPSDIPTFRLNQISANSCNNFSLITMNVFLMDSFN